jgi:hypothetical protein
MTHDKTLRWGLAAVTLTAALALLTPAKAETVALKAALSGTTEVPPNTEKGSGTVTLTYDTGTKRLSWKGNISALTGAPTAAHLHGPAEPGKNAGVMVPIPNPGPAFEGSALLSDAQATALLDGRSYVNIHTSAHPGGELRGQVTK